MNGDKITVCIILEGSYPYITGGVSAWVHDLIVNLPDIQFKLFTISPEKDQPLRYTLPQNVVENRDVVLSSYRKGRDLGKGDKEKLMEEIAGFHDLLFQGSRPGLEKVLSRYPENYLPYRDALENDTSWDLLTRANQAHNPLYPFGDYFWAWRSSHDMLFTVLGAEAPEADIYHAVSTGFAGMAALAARIRKGKPFLLTEHGLYHKEREMEIRKTKMVKGYQRDMWTRLYNSISRICYGSADVITALFEENRQKQLELGAAEEKTQVIPNGIDVERFSVPRAEREGFHVGLVGRVVPIKDIKTYIMTAKIVLETYPEAEFHCIGPTDEDPGYYEDCRLLVESLKIQDRFHFTGRANVLDYYRFLDVMLLTSVREAQPLVILEAYCAGVPVVSTRVGNVAELLDWDERFLANSRDSEKLAEGIAFIHDNPEEMKTINENNRRRVLEKYDKRDLHRRFRELYRKIQEGSEWRG